LLLFFSLASQILSPFTPSKTSLRSLGRTPSGIQPSSPPPEEETVEPWEKFEFDGEQLTAIPPEIGKLTWLKVSPLFITFLFSAFASFSSFFGFFFYLFYFH
jgi:hypothetical protein